jgi:hypothetical protein
MSSFHDSEDDPHYRESSVASSSNSHSRSRPNPHPNNSRTFLDRLRAGSTDTYDHAHDDDYQRRGEGSDLGLGLGGGDTVQDELGEEDGDGDERELDDVRRLGKVWVRERGMVGIGQWEGDLVDSLFDKLEQQVSRTLTFPPHLCMDSERTWEGLARMRTWGCWCLSRGLSCGAGGGGSVDGLFRRSMCTGQVRGK